MGTIVLDSETQLTGVPKAAIHDRPMQEPAALRSTSPDAKRSGVQGPCLRPCGTGARAPLRGPGKVALDFTAKREPAADAGRVFVAPQPSKTS